MQPQGKLPPAIIELLELANRKKRPRHQEFLDLVVRILCLDDPRRKVFVCLWLRDWKKLQYLLDLVSITGADSNEILRKSINDRLLRVAVAEAAVKQTDADQTERTLANHPRIKSVVSEQGVANFTETYVLKDRGDRKSSDAPGALSCRCIGFLQVWSNVSFLPLESEVVNWTARSLATNLFRYRSRRELEALRRTQEAFLKDGTSVRTWYKTAAQVLGEITNAEYCMVWTPALGRQLKSVAAWSHARGFEINPERFVAGSNSVVRRQFETSAGVIRLANWTDADERRQVCGTADYDEALEITIRAWAGHQTAWMAAPVVFRNQVLAVIVLFNKRFNLPRQFSATDEGILESVCNYLANVLPPILARKMIENAANEEVGTIAWLGAREQRETITNSAKLLEALQSTVPNISGATLWIDDHASEAEAITVHLGGDDFLRREAGNLREETNGVQTANDTVRSVAVHFFVLKIRALRQSTAHFGVTLTTARLSDHEEDLLRLFARVALTNSLRAREFLEMELRVFVEMRHNIRAGLNGLGHLTVALNIFDFLKQRGYPHVVSLIQKAGKSIRRAHLFAESSRLLMEHTRLLQTGLSNKDLTPLKTSIGEIVREVNLALAPDADRYKIPVDLADQIPRNEDVEVDRPLMYIVIFNLVENAIKYSKPHEHVLIRLFLADRYWHCEVENTGYFLDAETKEEIFQPFVRRFDSELRKARPGTGIGLPTVRLIVEAHRGRVSVASIPRATPRGDPRRGETIWASNTFSISIPKVIR